MNNPLIIFLLLTLFISPVVNGEDMQLISYDEKDAIEKLRGISLIDLLQIEVAVASKNKESLFEAPASVTVFSRQDLLDMGITSIESLLNFVPGFIATRELMLNSGYMVSARGNTTPHASYNILFMIDGQRLNDTLSGGALAQNTFIPIANVKQVEIIRGPGSALYGTSAFSGVVNIITVDNVNDAFVSAGNLASREAYINAARQEDKWGFSAFARYFEDNGQAYISANQSLFDPIEGGDIQLKSRLNKLKLNFHWSERAYKGFSPQQETTHLKDIFTRENWHGFLKFDYQLLKDETFELSLDGDYTTIRNFDNEANPPQDSQIADLLTPYPPGSFSILSENLVQSIEIEEDIWHLGVNGNYKIDDNHKISMGIDWYRSKASLASVFNYDRDKYESALSMQTTQPTSIPYYGQLKDRHHYLPPDLYREVYGFYIQDKYRFNPQWQTTVGLRYDYYSDTDGTLSPRLAVTYNPFERTHLKLMYGEAFRAPSIRQSSTLRSLSNPALKPETINSTELAWLQKFDKTQMALTYFYSEANDKIDTIIVKSSTNESVGMLRKFANTARILTEGLELELSHQFSNDLSLRMAYSYLTKTEENPQRFPTQTFSFITNYRFDRWNFNLNGFYHDEVEYEIYPLPNSINLEDYWLINAAVRYKINDNMQIVGRIHNLFDKEYYSSSKYIFLNQGVPNRGQQYHLGIELRF